MSRSGVITGHVMGVKAMKLFKTLVVVILLVVGAATLSGCNTVKGIGNDIYSAGETTQDWINGSQADGGY